MQYNETPMPEPKTEMITARLSPSVKEVLRQAAEREHRSLANMLEVMIREWCEREGMRVPGEPQRAD